MNDCLLPVVERIFRKKHPQLEPEIVVETLVEAPQEQEQKEPTEMCIRDRSIIDLHKVTIKAHKLNHHLSFL